MLITLSLGFNGASTMTNLQNPQDLAPNFAGSVYGIINFVGITSGFITPLIVSHFTAEKVGNQINFFFEQSKCCSQLLIHLFILIIQSTSEEWKWIFLIGAILYIVPAIQFMIFGSTEVQKWNNCEEAKPNDNIESAPKTD